MKKYIYKKLSSYPENILYSRHYMFASCEHFVIIVLHFYDDLIAGWTIKLLTGIFFLNQQLVSYIYMYFVKKFHAWGTHVYFLTYLRQHNLCINVSLGVYKTLAITLNHVLSYLNKCNSKILHYRINNIIVLILYLMMYIFDFLQLISAPWY